MKNINNLLTLLTILLILGACEKDGDTFFLSSPKENELVASVNKITLTKETAQLYAMSFAWTNQTLQISDERNSPTTNLQFIIQASLNENFTGDVEESIVNGFSQSYTIAALNILTYRLNAIAEQENPVYFRLATSNGSNIKPVYSNTVKVTITPYPIDMRYANILAKESGEDTGKDLYSVNADGIYQGFYGATGWEGIHVEEANGNIWFTDAPGGIGAPFQITTTGTIGSWDLWFPELEGCYFTELNAVKKQWSALYLGSLNIEGMPEGFYATYDHTTNQWKGVFDGTANETLNLRIGGTGKLFNKDTGDNKDNAKDVPFAFGGTAEQLTFSTGEGITTGSISVIVPATGSCTLVIDLNNPAQWTAKVQEGGNVEPEPEPEEGEYLYLPGIGAAVNGKWAYDHRISVYDKDEKKYAGVVNVASEWGDYAITLFGEGEAWNDSKVYKCREGNSTNGKLTNSGGNNITAPDNGLYLIEVSLSELTYKTTAVTEVACYLGIPDNEDLISLQSTDTPGIYSGSITLPEDSKWGVQFVINSWAGYFGGYEGKLYYNANEGIKSMPAGTYNVTVDFINATYSFNRQ